MSYAHAQYAQSLADFGSPRHLPGCGGWVLERPIPGWPGRRDAAGCYPLFRCAEWSGFSDDLAALRRDELVSLTLVIDPLCEPPAERLGRWFDGIVLPYKQHHLVDLAVPFAEATCAHHRRYVRRCARMAAIEVCAEPGQHLDTWCRLYAELAAHHAMTGPARFSREAFARQLALPGVRLLRAVAPGGEVLGLQMWFVEGGLAWYHLGAHGEAGHRAGVSFGLFAAAFDLLREAGVRTVDLGGGAGLADDPADGLSRFKAGWSTRTATAWLCGAVLDPAAYAHLGADRSTTFFPAYRAPRVAIVPEAVHADHA